MTSEGLTIREQRQLERKERVRKAAEVPKVRVLPRDDTMRELLKHPRAGGFNPEGSVEWPLDTFTRRRITDGDVTIEKPPEQKPSEEKQQPPLTAPQSESAI